MNKQNVLVVKITESGIVYAVDSSKVRLAAFDFGKISGYRGESTNEMKKLGLEVGKEVYVEYNESGVVATATIIH